MAKLGLTNAKEVNKALSAKNTEIAELRIMVHQMLNKPEAETVVKVEEFKLLHVDIINESKNDLPMYSLDGSAGVDLRAFLKKMITIKAGETKVVPTGLKMDIPVGYELQIRSRSGLALKVQVIALNAPGTIDPGFHGEIGLIIFNGGTKDFKVKNGDRIAQGVFAKYETVCFNTVTDFKTESEREEGGFGSTGIE